MPRPLIAVAFGIGGLLLAGGAATAAPAKETGGIVVKSATVLGNAWRADNSPLPNARVRLRNVVTGRIVATAVADEEGRFAFANVESGSFAVELVNDYGKVLAIGQAFALAPAETITTFVRLAARAPWIAGFFSNVATTAVTAASSIGVTALGSNGQPVSAAPGGGQ